MGLLHKSARPEAAEPLAIFCEKWSKNGPMRCWHSILKNAEGDPRLAQSRHRKMQEWSSLTYPKTRKKQKAILETIQKKKIRITKYNK